MSRIAYVNGRYLPQRHAAVNIEDRGYQFADGVYEVVQVFRGRLIDEDRHLARLERSLGELRIAPPVPRRALEAIIREVLARNRVANGLVYMQVTRGVARRDHAFPRGTAPALVVTARHGVAFPENLSDWTATAITVPDERWARCDIKSISLLPNVLAKQAARDAGAYEAILVGPGGEVREGSSTSIWIVDAAGVLRVRPQDHAILPGVTRAALEALMAERGVHWEARAFTVDELRAARECFLTSATSYVRPILAVDGRTVGAGLPGPVAEKLFALFARHVGATGRNA